MPLVHVYYTNYVGTNHGDLFQALGLALRSAVANRLTCDDEGGELAEQDVEVLFHEGSKYDINDGGDLLIDVEAMHFPSRHANFKARIEQLGADIRMMLPDYLGFGLWAKLNNAAWYEAMGNRLVITQADLDEREKLPASSRESPLGD